MDCGAEKLKEPPQVSDSCELSASSNSFMASITKRELEVDIVTREDSKRLHINKDTLESEEWNLPADTLVALKLMRDQFPKLEKVTIQPFVLKSQLYSSIKDRTTVDQELEALRQQGEIRVFKLNTGQDDFAIMLLDDYLFQVQSAMKRMEAKHGQNINLVLERFLSNVINANLEISITHSDLVLLLSNGGHEVDKHVSLLIQAGLLVRQLTDATTYWFSIPNVGPVLKNLTSGRKEVLQFLSRKRYKEVFYKQLKQRGLRSSCLGVRFHVRDLLGSGKLSAIESSFGLLIRVAMQ